MKPRALTPLAKRFWSKVKTGPGCWEWQGCTSEGYGQLSVGAPGASKMVGAHRIAYALGRGSIPPGKLVCHRCDNPRCVRPSHLFLGTQAANMQDKVEKKRAWKPQGARHPNARLSESDVRAIRQRRAQGDTLAAIASGYGCSISTIADIATGRTWGHLK